MTRRAIVLTLWLLMQTLGCASRRGPATESRAGPRDGRWSHDDSKQVLSSAAVSDNPTLRAMAITTLAEGDASADWIKRGWFDPSPIVQRAMADQHPDLLTADDLARTGGDDLARTWAILHRKTKVSADALVDIAERNVLLAAVLGHAESTSTVLMDVRDGMIPPEMLFIDILVESGIPGMDQAMVEGANMAEDEMRLPLALAAQRLSPEAGQRALVDVLQDADEVTKIFAIEALTEEGTDGALMWLKRAARGEPGAVRQHARVGLVALGMGSIEEALAALDSPDRDLRAWAALCLGRLAENRSLPRPVIAALETSWRDESMLVRLAATRALIDGSNVGAIPLSPAQAKADLDAVAVMVARKWFLIHLEDAEKKD